MIGVELRTDGLLLIGGDGLVERADPIVLLPLDLVLEMSAKGILSSSKPPVYRFADQVSYQPIGFYSGCLIFQRVDT